jgi:ABC-type multidrug transport system ATPase subunit
MLMDPVQDTIIGVEKISAGYKNTTVLQDVSFEVNRGEIFIILGESGSGKSTLLKLMIGLNSFPAASSSRDRTSYPPRAMNAWRSSENSASCIKEALFSAP